MNGLVAQAPDAEARTPARSGSARVAAALARTAVMLTTDAQIDRRTLLEADSLEAAGWKVTILATPANEPGADDPRVVRIGAVQGTDAVPLQATVLTTYRKLRRALHLPDPVLRAIRAFAWRYLLSHEQFYVNLFAPSLPAFPADVFVAQDLPMLPVALHAARLHGAKVVYDSHELFVEQEFTRGEKRMWRRMESRGIGQCDAVITVNPSIARELEKRYGLARVHVVHNAERARPERPPTRRFHERLGLAPEALVLLMQGGLSPGRHIEHLVEAMAQVRQPLVHLVVLGDGALRDTLQSLVERHRLQDRVHLLPAVPQHELLDWTEAADAGVIPYQATCLNNYYCTPNKLFEFIAAGLPVLASDLPEIRRIVTGHGFGQVTGLGDATKMAAAIDEFFRDPERLRGWRAAASRARADINWEVEGRTVVGVFEALR